MEYGSKARKNYEIPSILPFLKKWACGSLFPEYILENSHHQNYKLELCEYLYGLVAKKMIK